ncbi:MAG: insulinase family protein [Polyangiales bacterium]
MNRILARLLAVLIAATSVGHAAPSAAQAAPAPSVRSDRPLWPHLASDIAPDPAVKYGVLPNGMRYALMRNQLPPGAVSIRFSFEFGSVNETDDEQGLAHFIEHMAFNGSTHVPEGEMVRTLERLGLAFGADTNASTGQKFTTYMLELPNASDTLVNESLFLMRETASELTFDAGAVDRERGVVLAEWRRSDDFSRQRLQQQLDFLIPGAFAATRLPIGKRPVLETAPRERLVSLYERYYRPERATLVIVGDFDVAAYEQKIYDRFADWTGKGVAGLDPDLTWRPAENVPARVSVFTHKDGGDWIDISSVGPYIDEPDTVGQRRADSVLALGLAALDRRLAPLANLADPPFRSASFSSEDAFFSARLAGATVTVTPDSWKPGLFAVEQEWRRALRFGFGKDEVALELAAQRTAQENAARRQATRTTSSLASSIVSSAQNKRVFSTPADSLARFESWASQLTPEQVHAEVTTFLQPTRPQFFFSTSVPRPGIEAELLAAWEESAKVEVAAPADKPALSFAYTDFGPAGKVASDTRLDDIDARLVVFENQVRLNLKKTRFQQDSVQVSVRVAGGDLDLPLTPHGLSSLMGAFSEGGLEKHSSDDLERLFASRAVSAYFDSTGTAFGGTYATTPRDLDLQLQILTAFLTSPGYRPEAERRWRQSVQLSWPQLDANASTVWSTQGTRLLASGDKRFGVDRSDGEVERTFAELKAVLTPRLQSGPIEIAIVGDIDEAQAIDAVAKTFGALPAREPLQTKFKSDVPVRFRAERSPITLAHAGPASQALAYVFWPVSIDPDVDPQAARVLSVLAGVMRLKVVSEIREALGATYSPSAGSALYAVYPGYGFLSAGAEVKPEDVDTVLDALKTIGAQLQAGEISDDELSRAITPNLEALPRNASSNAYWLSLLSQAQSRPDLLARNKLPSIEASIRKVTKADVLKAASTWLDDTTAQEARVVPAKKPAN